MGNLVVTLFVAGLIFGAFGAMIAKNKGADGTTGFLLGAFLGPIGCLIAVFLSPAPAQSTGPTLSNTATPKIQNTPPKDQSLENAQYRLWLVKTYGIERNEVLGEVICGERSFKTIDDALRFAHESECDKKRETEKAQMVAAEELGSEAKALGITFDGEMYYYKNYRYNSLKDAVNYARLGKE